MDKENVVYIHVKNYSAIRKNGILLFAGKWIELEIIMLNKIRQAQKAKYCMGFLFFIFLLIWDMTVKGQLLGGSARGKGESTWVCHDRSALYIERDSIVKSTK
jgi:hypothetical protein